MIKSPRLAAVVLAAAPCLSVNAASELLYDSQGFENLGAAFDDSGNVFADASSQSLPELHPATPQPDALFQGSTLETLWIDGQAGYSDPSGTGGVYTLGMMGSPVGTLVYRPNGTPSATSNYDVFSLPVSVASCPAVTGVRVEFDMSLSSLLRDSDNRPSPVYYTGEVAPVVDVGLFDVTNIDINFNTQLQNSTQTGVRPMGGAGPRPTPLTGYDFAWSHHSVTLALTEADLATGEALLTISGAGSAAANELTYVALDNVQVYLESPEGCATSTAAQPVPAGNVVTLLMSMLGLVAMAGMSVFGYRPRITR